LPAASPVEDHAALYIIRYGDEASKKKSKKKWFAILEIQKKAFTFALPFLKVRVSKTK